MDLEYADRIAENPGIGDIPQVWLTADAAPDILDRLEAGGLTVISDETAAGLDARFDSEAPPSALRFQLVAAMAGLLLTAGAFIVVAAVERPERAGELAALRAQGLPPERGPAGRLGRLRRAGGRRRCCSASARARWRRRSPAGRSRSSSTAGTCCRSPSARSSCPLGLAALGALLVVGAAGAAAAALLVRAVVNAGSEESA